MRYLGVALAVLLMSITMPSISQATGSGHGCASPVPPVVPGSPAPAPAASGIIVLNEVLLVPHSTWNCSESGTYSFSNDSWLELYNTQNQPFNLYASHTVIDSGPNTNAYSLPFGTAIAAHGYLVLFPRTSVSFVSTETPTLRLVISRVAVDQVTVPQLGQDASYARIADGASSWQTTTTPTIDASNTSAQPTPTPTPRSSSSRYGGSGSTYTGTATTGSHYSKTLVNGTQPQWGNLQLPATTPTSTTNISPTTGPSPSPPATSGGLDVPRRIALTLLSIALALTLFWCWRILKSS